MPIPLSIFWPESSFSNFYYATADPKSDSTKNQLSNHRLSGQYALNQPNNMILLLQQLGHIINLKRSVLFPTQKLVLLGLEIEQISMTLTLSMEKVFTESGARRSSDGQIFDRFFEGDKVA